MEPGAQIFTTRQRRAGKINGESGMTTVFWESENG
jgi:hypothetical protein